MTTRQVVLGLAGATLMSWGGSFISTRLGLSVVSDLSVLAFAVGILCFSMLSVASLAARVAELERLLAKAPLPQIDPTAV